MPGWLLQNPTDDSVRFRLLPGAVKTVGRATQADFIVDAELVSRVHCRLTADRSDQLIVEDLDSTNGTMVNGKRVTRSVLREGDTLSIGRLDLSIGRDAK